jgi:hypothetical protein
MLREPCDIIADDVVKIRIGYTLFILWCFDFIVGLVGFRERNATKVVDDIAQRWILWRRKWTLNFHKISNLLILCIAIVFWEKIMPCEVSLGQSQEVTLPESRVFTKRMKCGVLDNTLHGSSDQRRVALRSGWYIASAQGLAYRILEIWNEFPPSDWERGFWSNISRRAELTVTQRTPKVTIEWLAHLIPDSVCFSNNDLFIILTLCWWLSIVYVCDTRCFGRLPACEVKFGILIFQQYYYGD